jgi:hypothetical protein
MDTRHELQQATWEMIAEMERARLKGDDGQVQWLENPEINSLIVISSTSISFRRLVGNIRRSVVINSPLGVCSGDRVTGMNRRRCFSLFSTIAPSPFDRLVFVSFLKIFIA